MVEPGESTLREAASAFAFDGSPLGIERFGGGHINSSFLIRTEGPRDLPSSSRYLLQLVNTEIFRDPEGLMSNILRVTNHLASATRAYGLPEPERRSLRLVFSKDGRPWWRDAKGGFWRAYRFIEGCHSLEVADEPAKAFSLGEAVGRFQSLLSDLPGGRLVETIPDFHNARSRFAAFEAAVAKDRVGRARFLQGEIAWFHEHREGLYRIREALESGEIPERVTHNDAKMANILIDKDSGEVICVVDLDTVMPGSPLYDFGDLARTVPASVEEDSELPESNRLRRDYYEALLRGYAAGAASFLTPAERRLLPEAGRVITLIMALRFFTDHLEGDRYFRVGFPDHNLRRARTQMALVESMEENSPWLARVSREAFGEADSERGSRP